MAELSGVEVLQSEIEKSKDKLKYYNENFKKLTGRDPGRPGQALMFKTVKLASVTRSKFI